MDCMSYDYKSFDFLIFCTLYFGSRNLKNFHVTTNFSSTIKLLDVYYTDTFTASIRNFVQTYDSYDSYQRITNFIIDFFVKFRIFNNVVDF